MVQHFGDERDWFFRKRFGLFIHWGLYALPAWHEQAQLRQGIARAEYGTLLPQFNPTRFDPFQWLDLMEEVGQEYLCITAKHHDGFCLWDTAETSFNIMRTPYGRDIISQLADACHQRQVPLCLYYSVGDWHHPQYPHRGQSHELPAPVEGDVPDLPGYLAYLRRQVTELCTRYGTLHGIWWDMNQTGVEDPGINAMIRRLQPSAVINNRGFDEGDFGTPERDWDTSIYTDTALARPTEACQSVGAESWGYRETEHYFTPAYLISSLDRYLAKGANYLLNVGPQADGTIGEESVRRLRAVGSWYRRVREAFTGTEPVAGLIDHPQVLVTRRGTTLYLHLNPHPAADGLSLKPLTVLPHTATLLNTGEPVDVRVDILPSQWREQTPYLRLCHLPVEALAQETLVVKLEFTALP